MDMLIKEEKNKYAKEFYESLKNEGYKTNEKYKNAKGKISVSCNEGHEYKVSPSKFKSGSRCSECYKEYKKKIHADKFYKDLKDNGYRIENDEYKGVHEKVRTRCPKGHIYMVTPTSFRIGYRCSKCLKLSYKERFYKSLEESGYSLAEGERYTLMKNHVWIKCPKGHTYKTTPDNFLGSKNRKGKRCTRCNGGHRMTHEEFSDYVDKQFNGEISVIGKYINTTTNVLVRHNNESCGFYEWEVYPPNLTVREQKCPKCAGNAREGIEGFKRKVYEQEGDNYAVLGKYINSDTPIRIRHNNELCFNYEWEVIPFNFTSHGTRCPRCNESSGERLITRFLQKEEITFQSQVTFDDCRYKHVLPFDFAIYDGLKVICLIEYQGKQHYESIDHFGGQEQFEIRKIRDNIKRTYCKDNNIPLLEIPYWEKENINKILTKELSQLLTK